MKSRTLKSQKKQLRNEDSIEQFCYLNDRLESILSMFQSLLTDFVHLNSSYRNVDSARDLQTIKTRLENEGLGFLSTTLPGLMSRFFDYTQTGVSLYPGFKLQPGTEHPAFLGRLFGSVYQHDENETISFAQIYQLCVLFKKLRGPYRKSVLSKELDKFLQTEEELSRLDFTAEPLTPILEKARDLIETVFADVEISGERILPRPGPGATNTPVDKHLRFEPHTVYTRLDDEFDFLETFYTHSWDPHRDAQRYMNLPIKEEATSRFKFIAKYLGKPRGICIEENEMQFFQQGVKRFLYDHLERHPATRGRINFRSQSINQSLALASSACNGNITIDMSEASNRVARELVFRLFWNTKLFHLLDAISTRLMELPSKSELHFTQMYAPMGSGVCFPVMAICHWALIRAMISLSSLDDSEKLAKEVYVYGDDVIVPRECTEVIFTYLPLFGMKLNTDKSFSNGPFRESCGIHAYMGVDVTPVYVNHITKNYQEKCDTTVLLSLIAKEHLFHQKGYNETSQCIKSLVSKHYWQLPTVGSETSALGWIREGRTHIHELFNTCRRYGWSMDEQTWKFDIQVVVPRKTGACSLVDQGRGYLRKLLTFADEPCTFPGRVEDLQVRRRWLSLTAC